MKFISICLAACLVILLIATTPVQAQSPMDFLQRSNRLTIVVQCMEEAWAQMAALPGIETSSSLEVFLGRGSAVRLVPATLLDTTLAQLHEMGEVIRTESHAINLFGQWTAVAAEFQLRNHEYLRLIELLYQVETIREFNQIETRLRTVIAWQEQLRGRLNLLEQDMGNAQISVHLIQYVPGMEIEEDEEEEPSRLRQIANAFMNSARGTLAAAQAILLFIVRVSLPFVALLIILIIAVRVIKSKWRRRKIKEEKNDDENS